MVWKRLVIIMAVMFMPLLASGDTVVAPAEDVTYVLPVLADGTYVLTIKDGKATLKRAVVVTTDIAPIPPQPNPKLGLKDEATRLGNLVQDSTRKTSARAIAALYRETAKLALDGKMSSGDQVVKATDFLFSAVLKVTGKVDAWVPWKTSMDIAIKAKGLSTVAEYAAGWEEIAKGLDAVGDSK